MAHFVRGVVVEGMGVAALVMLYVTIQSTSADGVLEKGEQRLVGVETKSNQAAELQGPQLPSWCRNRLEIQPAHSTTAMCTTPRRWKQQRKATASS